MMGKTHSLSLKKAECTWNNTKNLQALQKPSGWKCKMDLEIFSSPLVMIILLSTVIATFGLMLVLFRNRLVKTKLFVSKLQTELDDALVKLSQKQKQAFQMGGNVTTGNMHQIIGEFAMLDEYDELITLSTTSKAPSLDMIGIKNDKLDFLEFKKKGAGLSTKERNIRRIIENKNVEYIVKEIEIPTDVTVQTKELPPIRTKSVQKAEADV